MLFEDIWYEFSNAIEDVGELSSVSRDITCLAW